jgi:hypothetical protein
VSSNSQDATAENQESAVDQGHFKPLPRYKPEKVREFDIKQLQEQQKSLEHRRDKEQINLAVLIDFKEKVCERKLYEKIGNYNEIFSFLSFILHFLIL